MTIKEAFKEVFVGYNYINSSVNDKYAKVYKTLHKESIEYNTIITPKLVDKAFSNIIKEKYFLQPDDIIIYIKKPFGVAIVTRKDQEEIVLPNNFILLRGINEKYNPIFVSNYLNKIGINKYIEDNNKTGNLTLVDIEDLELPNLELEKQLSISPLLSSINKRSSIYANILDNDSKIIDYALESVLGDKND